MPQIGRSAEPVINKRYEAEAQSQEAVEGFRRVLGNQHWVVGNFLGKRGRALQVLERYDKAAEAMLAGYANLGAALGEEQAMLLRAIEEKRFLSLGADLEVRSDFQLIAGTNRDLSERVARGEFREDLLARINLWIFELPGLRERPEDIEPNLEYELDRYARDRAQLIRFSKEARKHFLDFSTGPDGLWPGNFRDLGAALTRMATLAPGGRISREVVDEESGRLQHAWRRCSDQSGGSMLETLLGLERLEDIDLFDRVQLAAVVKVCRQSRSMSDAGRKLFAASRSKRSSVNDSDRLRKYLAKFGLGWDDLQSLSG